MITSTELVDEKARKLDGAVTHKYFEMFCFPFNIRDPLNSQSHASQEPRGYIKNNEESG